MIVRTNAMAIHKLYNSKAPLVTMPLIRKNIVFCIAGHQLARQVEPLGRVVFHIPGCIDVTPVLSTGDLCFGLNFHLHVETLALLMAENDAEPGLDGCLLLCQCRYGKQDEYNPPMCCL